MKNNTNISTLHDFSHKIYFYCWKKLKKHVFSFKIGLTTRNLWRHIGNHSNWPSLNLAQNLREEWTSGYWKRQVLLFYPLRKKELRKALWRVASRPLRSPSLVCPTVNCFWSVIVLICLFVYLFFGWRVQLFPWFRIPLHFKMIAFGDCWFFQLRYRSIFLFSSWLC